MASIKQAAEKLKIELQILEIRNSGDLDRALRAGIEGGSLALVQRSSPLFDNRLSNRKIADFTIKHRLPAISISRVFPEAGGLMAYGPNRAEDQKRSPIYIDKILRGAKPADLPIEQPTKFDFVINLRTAKALGLTIPQSLRVQAELID